GRHPRDFADRSPAIRGEKSPVPQRWLPPTMARPMGIPQRLLAWPSPAKTSLPAKRPRREDSIAASQDAQIATSPCDCPPEMMPNGGARLRQPRLPDYQSQL